ncbi:thioredoxin reductase [Crossiella equi]|uniref:Thioredoxin reductase n=2 Tax=Crossiella equi TaxID=130796 RepID=A0ABS5ANF1_9PSEU|nr:thioredoxin reductase [Crossiella equi]
MSTVEGSAVVLATGAYDRVLPVPGWDLPGVYSAGAGQAMAKGQGVAVGKRVVVAGTGPFLLPVACSLLDFGAEVVGVMEASGVREQVGWWRDPVGVVGKVGELGRYVTRLAYSRVEMQMRAAVVAVHGDRRVEAVTVARLRPDWTVVPGSGRVVDVDAVCLGFGFTAQLELAVSAGCRVEDGAVVVDGAQRTSVPRVFAAGELTGVAGAWAAVAEGTVAGYTAAADCVDSQVVPPTPALKRAAAGRRFGRVLRSVYRVKKGWHGWVSDDTVLCRCEEIRWADLRDQLAQGVLGTRALRLNSRAGLGLCQGRVCGRNVADLTGLPDSANRPIALPVRLSDLATADLPKEST